MRDAEGANNEQGSSQPALQQALLYKLADIGTTMTRKHSRVVSDVVRVGWIAGSPPGRRCSNSVLFQRHKRQGTIDELIAIVTRVPDEVSTLRVKYGPGSAVRQPSQSCRAPTYDLRKLSEDVRRKMSQMPNSNEISRA